MADDKTPPVKDPVAKVEEKTDDVRSLDETLRAEARNTVDQIPDYHQKNPTLDTSGPQFSPEFAEKVRSTLVKESVTKEDLATRKEQVLAVLPESDPEVQKAAKK